MRVESPNEQRELMTLEDARKEIGGCKFWSTDVEAQKSEIEAMPEVERTRIGVRQEGVLYPILDRAGLRRQTGIAPQFMQEIEDDAELYAKVVNHCLKKRAGFLVRFSGNKQGVTTVTEAKGAWIPPLDVFDIIGEELGGGVSEIDVSRRGLKIEFVGSHEQARKKDSSDIVRAGLIARVNGQLSVGSYCYQVVCSNGMVRVFEKLKLVDELSLLKQEVRSICQAQHADSRQLIADYISLDDIPYGGNREQTLVRLGRQANLPRRFLSMTLEQLPELSDDATMFDVISMITRMAQRFRRPERLQMAAGRMTTALAHNGSRCAHCGTALETE